MSLALPARLGVILALLASLLVAAPAVPATATSGDLLITGVIDGPLSGGVPKAVELYANADIADLGAYQVANYNNGGLTRTATTPLSGSAEAGDFVYVSLASGEQGFVDYLGLSPTVTGNLQINGDDAVTLERVADESIVDVFGVIGTDGTGQPWEYQDGWAYRADGTGADGDVFQLDNWTFSGADALDGETSNATATSPWPLGTYSAGDVDPTVVINEFVANHTGTDTEAFIEVFGPPNADLSDLTLLELEADTGGLGVVDHAETLGTTDADGYWLSSEDMENGSIAVLLVRGFTGAAGDDLDSDDDGVLDVTPWDEVVDSVGVNDGGAGDASYATPTLTVAFDGQPFAPGGASRIPNGVDTDSASDWVRNDFDLAGIDGFVGTPQPGEALNTPGAANAVVEDDPGGPGDPPAVGVVVNELDSDTPGTDVAEFVELYDGGEGNTSLDGLVVVFYNGNGDTSYRSIDLDGLTTDADGYLVLGNEGVAGVEVTFPSNGLQNGADAVALHVGDAGDFPNGTAVTDTGLVDAIVYGTGDADDDGLLAVLGGPQVDEDANGSSPDDSVQRCPDGGDEFRVTAPTPGAANACEDDPVVDPIEVFVHEVQGDGPDSPLEDVLVTVEAVVVGDFQNGDAGSQNGDAAPGDALGGFYLQEEDTDVDTDPQTSEGVFVFDGTFSGDPAVDVALGDLVRVTGTVEERFGQTQISVVSGGTVEVVASDVAMPTPAELTLPFASLDAPEALEGMLVAAAQDLYVAEYFNLDRFGEMVLTQEATGLVTSTQAFAPGSPEQQDLADFNLRSQITLDDANGAQNPETIPFVAPPVDDGTYVDNRRRGDRIDDLVGVLGFGFSRYRVYVDTDEVTTDSFTTTNERPTAGPDVGGDVTVASFNVLNYFTTIDDGSNDICGPAANLECRGADSELELERQTAKTVTALQAIDADVVGLIEIENDGDDSSVATLVDGLNDELGAGTYDYVATGFVGTDAIKQALIYKPGAVTPVGAPAILDTDEFINGLQSTPKNRAALAQTFVDDEGGAVTVVVNHLKSKGSDCGPGDDATDGSGNCDGTRTRAAELLVDWIEDEANGFAEDVLVIGDLNSYAQERPIQVFLDAGYVNTVLADDPDAYGYVFDAQQGTLDYALASESLATQVTGSAEFGINADEADLIDYDTGFGRDPGYFNPAIPYRASDHDPVITGLELVPTAADAGGPYEVRVNETLELDASASTDGSGLGLSYAWDLDGDGVFDDATGETVVREPVGGPPGPTTVAVEVTDAFGSTSVDETELAVLANGRGNDGRPKGRFPANVR